VDAALRAQLARREALLATGARHVGWKIAKSMPGVEATIFGNLTTSTVLEPGGCYDPVPSGSLRAETELAVKVGGPIDPAAGPDACAAAVTGVGVALEIVDVARPPGGPG
jgi:2-keto-4-pentenoate hydratase